MPAEKPPTSLSFGRSCQMEPIPRLFGKRFGDYRDGTSTQGGGSTHRIARQQEPIPRNRDRRQPRLSGFALLRVQKSMGFPAEFRRSTPNSLQPFGTASRANVDCGRTEFDAISSARLRSPKPPRRQNAAVAHRRTHFYATPSRPPPARAAGRFPLGSPFSRYSRGRPPEHPNPMSLLPNLRSLATRQLSSFIPIRSSIPILRRRTMQRTPSWFPSSNPV